MLHFWEMWLAQWTKPDQFLKNKSISGKYAAILDSLTHSCSLCWLQQDKYMEIWAFRSTEVFKGDVLYLDLF